MHKIMEVSLRSMLQPALSVTVVDIGDMFSAENTRITSAKLAFSLIPLGFIEDKMKHSSLSKSKTILNHFCVPAPLGLLSN